MLDVFIPADCLNDARRVLAAQDPEVSKLAQHWPGKVWRAAIKVAAAEEDRRERTPA